MVDIYLDAKGDSCFSIYQIRWLKKCCFNFFFWNFRETTRHFSLRSQNSEYPRVFRVTGANQNARKLLSTDVVNTNKGITWLFEGILFICARVVSFAAQARSARAANDTTRAQIDNIPEKSHVIIIIINKQGQMTSRMRGLIIQAKWITNSKSLQINM